MEHSWICCDWDDTILSSNVSKHLLNEPDFGAQKIKDKLSVFIIFAKYWKILTHKPVIIFSAGNLSYVQLVSLYGREVNMTVNYYDTNADLCIFCPIPFSCWTSGKLCITLVNNNDINIQLHRNTSSYYKPIIESGLTYHSVNKSQLMAAQKTYSVNQPTKQTRDFSNGCTHKKISYDAATTDVNLDAYFVSGINAEKKVDLYEYLDSKRQFKNLDAIRRHIAQMTGYKPLSIHFYFFDDKFSHLGMNVNDLYLSKPVDYPATYFVGKIIPILRSVVLEHKTTTKPLAPRTAEKQLLDMLKSKLDKEIYVVQVKKTVETETPDKQDKTK
jgi:hypothetical protein